MYVRRKRECSVQRLYEQECIGYSGCTCRTYGNWTVWAGVEWVSWLGVEQSRWTNKAFGFICLCGCSYSTVYNKDMWPIFTDCPFEKRFCCAYSHRTHNTHCNGIQQLLDAFTGNTTFSFFALQSTIRKLCYPKPIRSHWQTCHNSRAKQGR